MSIAAKCECGYSISGLCVASHNCRNFICRTTNTVHNNCANVLVICSNNFGKIIENKTKHDCCTLCIYGINGYAYKYYEKKADACRTCFNGEMPINCYYI